MCVIFLAWQRDPRRRLLVAANRDEYRARPTAPLGVWPDRPDVIGGRDLAEGGSWLAARPDGRFAAVTNFRSAPLTRGARSRGDLVREVVLSDEGLDTIVARLWPDRALYGGFHLVMGDGDRVLHLSNHAPEVRELAPGVHAISNGPIDQRWPKMRRGDDVLAREVAADRPDEEALFALLADRTPAPDDALPDTGVGLELERMLSPVFIDGEVYGTRASTVLRLDADGLRMRERRYGAAGLEGETTLVVAGRS